MNDLIILKYVEKVRLLLVHFISLSSNPYVYDCHTPSRFRSLVRLLFVCWLCDVCMWTTLCIYVSNGKRKIRREKIWHLQRLMMIIFFFYNDKKKIIFIEECLNTVKGIFSYSYMILLVLMWLDMHEWLFDGTNNISNSFYWL